MPPVNYTTNTVSMSPLLLGRGEGAAKTMWSSQHCGAAWPWPCRPCLRGLVWSPPGHELISELEMVCARIFVRIQFYGFSLSIYLLLLVCFLTNLNFWVKQHRLIPMFVNKSWTLIILKISLWRRQAGALTSSCALIMILFINHEWILGGSWDAKIRLQTTRQGMRDPHYQWIGSIRNRQGTSDDTDTRQEGHKTSSIIWFIAIVLL